MEFCWVYAHLQLIWLVMIVLDVWGIETFKPFASSEQLFIIYFMTTTGVFGVSAVAFNNAIVLHDGDLMASVFIHLTPTTAAWCFRWYREEHEKLWPGLFGIPINHDFTFWEMFAPAMGVYMVQWVLNITWLLTYAKKLGYPHNEQDYLFTWCARGYTPFFKWAYNYDEKNP